MYQPPFEVIEKSGAAFQKERHTEENRRAAIDELVPRKPQEREARDVHPLQTEEKREHPFFRSYPFLGKDWGAEEVLLAALIVWQLCQRERDFLLIGVLVFLLFLD